jgi:hypothetical protein
MATEISADDRFRIQDILRSYVWANDSGGVERVVAAFTPDGAAELSGAAAKERRRQGTGRRAEGVWPAGVSGIASKIAPSGQPQTLAGFTLASHRSRVMLKAKNRDSEKNLRVSKRAVPDEPDLGEDFWIP